MEIPGGGRSTMKSSGIENPGGWGFKLEKTLSGGYGYFLEAHNAKIATILYCCLNPIWS